MDRIRRLFGFGRDSSETRQQTTDSPLLQPDQTKPFNDVESDDTPLKSALNSVETSLRKVVPLKEGDCLSCKLIGTTGCFCGAAYIIHHWKHWKHRYSGRKQILVNIGILSAAAYLTFFGVCRFYDIGMPAKPGNNRAIPAETNSRTSDTR